MNNNYNHYNSNSAWYEDGANNKKDNTTYEDVTSANATHKNCTNDTENTPENYKPETMDNNTVDEITGMGDAG